MGKCGWQGGRAEADGERESGCLGKVFSGSIADEGNVLNEAAEIDVDSALVFSAARTFVQCVCGHLRSVLAGYCRGC
jgi:hypothetical protein